MATPRTAAPLLRQASLIRSRRDAFHAPPAVHTTLRVRTHSTGPSSTSSSSVSPDEVAHFNALATSWWDPYGPSRLLHQMNPLRHDFLRACVASSAAPADRVLPRRLLDVGCGGGIFAESAARLKSTESVVAIDPSAGVLDVARAHARRDPALPSKLTYRQASIEDLATAVAGPAGGVEDGFDMVTLFEVIEHVATDPGQFLAQCGQLVRPGGWLVLSTMARTWTSWLTTVVAAENVLGIVPRGTHDWAKYVNADELLAYVGQPAGMWQLDSARFRGVAYVPGLGWRTVMGGEKLGNYFFGIQRAAREDPVRA